MRTLADAARLVADAASSEREEARLEARAAAARVLPRLVLFGALPPSSLPTLVAARRFLDNPSAKPASVDRKLLRLAGYLLQVAAGEGSAGTPVPFSPLVGGAQPPRAVDIYEPSALDAVWAHARSGSDGVEATDPPTNNNDDRGAAAAAAAAARVAPHQRAAAFRALAALSRSSLVADAAAASAGGGDITLVSHLMAAAATTLDRADAARRRGPSAPRGLLGGASRDAAERLAALERTAAARTALCASRVGLPRAVLSAKMAPRAFGLVNSPDALCARHALAVAAAAAREAPRAYAEALAGLLEVNVQQFRSTGSLAGLADPAAAAALEDARQSLAEAVSAAAAAAAAGEGAGGEKSSGKSLTLPSAPSRPIRPSKDALLLKGEARCVNAIDAWARVYLARGCGAVIHVGGYGAGGGSTTTATNPFWETLTILACCDRSNIVSMEAIRALCGAGEPSAADALKPAGGKRAAPQVDEAREQRGAAAAVAAWRLLLSRAEDEAPGCCVVPSAGGAVAAEVAAQFSAARAARRLPETPALARLCADPEEEEERQRQALMALVQRRQEAAGGGNGGGGKALPAAPAASGGPLSPAAAAALAYVAERQQQQQQQWQQGRQQGQGGGADAAEEGPLGAALAAVLPELPPPAGPLTLIGAIAQRLLAALAPGASQASMCSASRAVAALAEARARAAAAARSRDEREAALGSPTVRAVLGALEDRVLAVARGDAGGPVASGSGAAAAPAAHLRSLALSALLWFQVLPGGGGEAQGAGAGTAAPPPPARLPPARVTEWLSSGGGSVAPAVRGIFADPWPEDVVASFLHQLHRRLVAAPAAAPYLLACAAAACAAAPSRVRHEQLHAMWDLCMRQGGVGGGPQQQASSSSSPAIPSPGAAAAVRAALARLSAPLPAVAQPPSAAAPEVKAFAAREEVGHWALARSAAWWLGENANYACGEFAWAPRRVPEELADALADWGGGKAQRDKKKKKKSGRGNGFGGVDSSGSDSDSDHSDDAASRRRRRQRQRHERDQPPPVLPAGQELLASAAATTNPLLTAVVAHLQRALVAGGTWEVRVSAAQALAKVAVRSGEPFRVQCYALLSAAAPGARAGLGSGGAEQQQQQQDERKASSSSDAGGGGAKRDLAIANPPPSQLHHQTHRGADPLGVAAAVAPALEVLDALYSAEAVVEALVRQYGRRRRAWPRAALGSLERRNRALLAAVLERVCFVPQDLFWPLGALARDVLKGRWDGEESTDEEEAEGEEGEGGERRSGGGEVIIATGEGVEEQLEAERQRLAQLELEKKKKEEEEQEQKRIQQQEEEERRQQQAAGGYADSDDSDAPPAAAQRAAAANRLAGQLQGYDYNPNAVADADEPSSAAAAAASSSQLPALRGTALYDFAPEDDDEVGVAEGESLRVEWEQGGWMQVVRADGASGLVPSSYVRLEEGGGGGGGGGQAARDAAADDEDDDEEIGDDDDSEVAAARLTRMASAAAGRRGSGELAAAVGFQRRATTTTMGGGGGGGGYGGGYAADDFDAEDDRLGEREDREAGAVDIAMAVGRLGNESAELGRAEGRLEELEQQGRGAAAANLPQLMALHESIEATVSRMDALAGPLGSDGRAMRRRLRARGLEMLERVELLRVGGGGGAGGATPPGGATPRGGEGAFDGGYGGAAGGAGPSAVSPRTAAGGGAGGAAASGSAAGVVAFAFSAEADGELSVSPGDRVAVEAEVDGWYSVVRESDGARGLIPASYVEMA
jgi:hypothetical protein